ncbi:MAG: sigma 54-interacting transcriptional regulator [Bacteroidota bacterium]
MPKQKETSPLPRAITGSSPQVRELRTQLQALAGTPRPLVLAGEPGAGKRHFARCLHLRTYGRSGAPFVECDPETDEEALRVILFDEGRRRMEGIMGRKLADLTAEGTLLVRNLHAFKIIAQTRLARFLVQQEQGKSPGVRVVFSFPDGVPGAGRRGPLMESLERSLRRFPLVTIAPLRERREDIPVLAEEFARRRGVSGREAIPADALEAFQRHPWHDNVRELRSVVRESLAGGTGFRLPGGFLDEREGVRKAIDAILEGRPFSIEEYLNTMEQAFLRRALIRCDYDKVRAASLLGMTEIHLRYRMRKFGLHDPNEEERKAP